MKQSILYQSQEIQQESNNICCSQKQVSTTTEIKQSTSTFICPCSRQYKSYAAIYTHVKSKHECQFEKFMSNAIRPNKGVTTRGRPRKYAVQNISDQLQKNNVLQCGLVDFCEQLNRIGCQKVVLGFEQQPCQGQIDKDYIEIVKKYGWPTGDIYQSDAGQQKGKQKMKAFFQKFSRHLSNQIAAKIRYTLNDFDPLAEREENKLFEYQKINIKGKLCEIWYGSQRAPKLIQQIFEKWTKL